MFWGSHYIFVLGSHSRATSEMVVAIRMPMTVAHMWFVPESHKNFVYFLLTEAMTF